MALYGSKATTGERNPADQLHFLWQGFRLEIMQNDIPKQKIGFGTVLRRGTMGVRSINGPGRSRGGSRGRINPPLGVWTGFGFVLVLDLYALRPRKLVASADYILGD